ncbi:MAG TPA: MoxR family ATPase [Elusimicrobiota bacterium]|jgi:MoxR-like ATPase|nr:MoxR family ATPase [Elusimicrobiota bacterium]
MTLNVREINEKVQNESLFVPELKKELGEVIVGQEEMIERLLVGLLARGHVLLEGVPGLAKTTTIKTIAQAIDAQFSRIQFTPDLLPADLTGTMIYNPKDHSFAPRKGPLFANLVLADEINRAPAKVQSALLEAMQERQVTIGDATHELPELFLVLATQNPIEQEGTYPLPEAQVDRFMMKLVVGYPRKEEERLILERMTAPKAHEVRKVVTPEQIFAARKVADQIYVDDKVKNYILDVVFATRDPGAHGLAKLKPLIRYGASPRATIFLTTAAKAYAFLNGRGFVTPEDVKSIGPDVLRHRVLVSYEAEAENVTAEDILKSVFAAVEVP